MKILPLSMILSPSVNFENPSNSRQTSLCFPSSFFFFFFSPSTTVILLFTADEDHAAAEKPEDSKPAAKDKRRAQVRRAQIQHRARKANYTKQLEADIESIRQQIEDVKRECSVLEEENQAVRAQLCESQQQQQQQQAVSDHGQIVENHKFHTTSTACLQDAAIGCGLHTDYFDLDYLVDVADPSWDEMLSPQCALSPEYGSFALVDNYKMSPGMYSSPQYIDSGNHKPHWVLPEVSSLDESNKVSNNIPEFP